MRSATTPALKGLNIPRTGQSGYNIGTLITKTLVIAGEGQITTTADHPRGAMLRAYDKATGKEVGAVYMPAPQSGSPMTYMLNGKQYIIVAVSGGAYSGEYIAFTAAGRGMTEARPFYIYALAAAGTLALVFGQTYGFGVGRRVYRRARPSAARHCIPRNARHATADR